MQRRHVTPLLALAAVFACGGGASNQRVDHTPNVAASVIDAGAPDASSTPHVADAADAASKDADVSAAAVPRTRWCGTLRWVPKFCYVRDLGDPAGAAAADVDEKAWLLSHGAKVADVKAQLSKHLLGAMCRVLSVGPQKEDALFCMYHTQALAGPSSSVYRGVQRVHITAVRDGALAVLLDVPFSFANFDAVGQASEGEETEIFGLQIDTQNAATKIVLSEPRSGDCAAATKLNADDIATRLTQKPVVPVEIETMRFDAHLLRMICSSAMTYAWTKGSYR